MSVWTLIVFAFCMLTAVVAFCGPARWTGLASAAFTLLLVSFVVAVCVQGVRRPVV